MLFQPKKIKFKKIHKASLSNIKIKSKINYGSVGLKALQSGTLTARQIESARKTISRKTKRKGKIWIKVFPNLPVTSKSSGVRMGKGVGKISHWVARVRGGTVLFELLGIKSKDAIEALRSGGMKLSIKTKTIELGKIKKYGTKKTIW